MKTSIKKHTINEMVEILEEFPQSDQLHIFLKKKYVTKNPFKEPFRSNYHTFLIILSGKLTLQLNLTTYILEPNDILIIKPFTVINILDYDEDLRLTGINFTLEFALENGFKNKEFDSFDFFMKQSIKKISISEEEVKTLSILLKLLHKKSTNINPNQFGKEIVTHSFNLFMYELAAICKNKFTHLKIEISRKEALTINFLNLLEYHFKKERSVLFYAAALFVTPGHLTKVVKEISGKTTSQLIDQAIIIEARLLLKNPVLSIAQIAEELQFSDQSFFGKFFKKQIGFSPSEYRKKV